MSRNPESPPHASGADADAEAPSAEPESDIRRPAASISILGVFILASFAVVLLSWPGLQTARHTRAAEAALERHDWEEAAPHLAAITERYPAAWLRQRQLGDCLLELGRPREALVAYQASLESEPNQELRARAGYALFQMEPDNAEAPRLLEEARLAAPADPRTNFYVAILRKEQERYREAAICFLGATADPYWFERSRPHIEAIRNRLFAEGG